MIPRSGTPLSKLLSHHHHHRHHQLAVVQRLRVPGICSSAPFSCGATAGLQSRSRHGRGRDACDNGQTTITDTTTPHLKPRSIVTSSSPLTSIINASAPPFRVQAATPRSLQQARTAHSTAASPKMYTASFAFFEALAEAGITHCFVNLGSDHPSIIEAMVKGQREQKSTFPRIITCPNEVSKLGR